MTVGNLPQSRPSSRAVHRVQSTRLLTTATFVTRIERRALAFRAGQCLSIGVEGAGVNREYSIYSGEADPYLEILVREVPGGVVSPALKHCRPGQALHVEGPYSEFVVNPAHAASRRYLFVATGTGIAPYHSYVRSYPGLDYLVLHGVRRSSERYDWADYAPGRYIGCVSSDDGGDFRGRVTDYLRAHPVEPQTVCYLCGNRAMIEEAYEILRAQGASSDDIFTEVFF